MYTSGLRDEVSGLSARAAKESGNDHLLAKAIAEYWTNFAKSLDPNAPGLPEWPRYTEAAPVAMIFHQRPAAGALPDWQHFDVLERYFAWRRSPQGQQR